MLQIYGSRICIPLVSALRLASFYNTLKHKFRVMAITCLAEKYILKEYIRQRYLISLAHTARNEHSISQQIFLSNNKKGRPIASVEDRLGLSIRVYYPLAEFACSQTQYLYFLIDTFVRHSFRNCFYSVAVFLQV